MNRETDIECARGCDRQFELSDQSLYRAMATMAAPPTINQSSRAKLAVDAEESVCRPGAGPVVVPATEVSVGCTTVIRVTVLCSPLGRVVVLL